MVQCYCTFASTDELEFSVRVQLFALLPPLEHAPDQIADRPFETVRVILVPGLNDAEPVLATGALIPAGLDVTRSPCLPPTVTLSGTVATGAGGFTVSVAERVTPPPETEIVTSVWLLTCGVLMLNPPRKLPAGIRTVLGTVTAGLLLVTEKIWSVLAAEATLTIPFEPALPVTAAGLRVRVLGCPCGVSVICVCTDWPL